MVNLLSKNTVAAALCALALSLAAGTGVAYADPVIDTTCSYPQVLAALKAENPDLGTKVSTNPLAGAMLSNFLASDPGKRQRIVQEFQGTEWGHEYFGAMASIANSCNNY